MVSFSNKKLIIFSLILVLIGIGIFVFVSQDEPAPIPELVVEENTPEYEIIGQSVEGRKIEAYTYGDGLKHLLFVGGIHGGYEWNSVVLAYKTMEYLEENPEVIPESISVTIIPSLNPDGVYNVIAKEGEFSVGEALMKDPGDGTGRFNANGVDLNRNFDCKWQPESTWRGDRVSAGTRAFSEPEARAIRDFVLENEPDAVVFWHSQSNAVYASECEEGILPETLDIMNAYSLASGYKPVESFDAYEITGDAEGWLASIGIPAITVELSTHEAVEWNENLAGIKSLFEYYEK